jgi:hypothetical protein
VVVVVVVIVVVVIVVVVVVVVDEGFGACDRKGKGENRDQDKRVQDKIDK